MRDRVSSPTHRGPRPWGMTVFFPSLFELQTIPTLSCGGKDWRDWKEVTVDKRFRERVGLRSLRRTNLIVQITPRQKQGRTKRQHMGASTTSTILSLSHHPLQWCSIQNDISPSYPMWVQIMRFCLVLIWKKKRSHIPSICQNPQQELDDEFHFVLCSRWAHNVHFYFVIIQFSFYPEGAGRKLWLCSSCGALWWRSRHSCQETLLGFERGENWGYV